MFALQYTVRQSSGLLSKSQSLVIDTIQIADAFRVAPVDVEGVTVDAGPDRTATVSVVFTGDQVTLDQIDTASEALRRHVDGGDVDTGDVTIHTDPGPTPDAVRDREITASWR